jgi:hypothetical protein
MGGHPPADSVSGSTRVISVERYILGSDARASPFHDLGIRGEAVEVEASLGSFCAFSPFSESPRFLPHTALIARTRSVYWSDGLVVVHPRRAHPCRRVLKSMSLRYSICQLLATTRISGCQIAGKLLSR